ncbi:hypothetical protein IMZ29_05670 [Achromobacter sp. GG226]|uniref:hypothetical protein n=1 Tax=Verticiella alkaliphila TaxID=2779529 RepID=UPI001C0D23CB|nr:hypothetical protein [Verticiella sp. GG226]MBU4610046.1 hypothetical protein [Verticiella sp. GG226]
MSEPCSFTALVHMTPPAFAAMMRSKALEPLAEAIAASVTDGLDDVVVFKYLKKEQALVVHCYFHYDRPLEDLLAQPEIEAILKAVQVKDLEGVDRAVISHDANNFLASPPSAGFAIRPGTCAREDGFDAATLARFDAVQDAHFFKIADQFQRQDRPWFTSSRIVDPALRRKIERKLQARRQAIAKSQLPNATLLQPVRLFADYHYNGHLVLWRDHGALVPLPGVDPYTLKQTAYGVADATQVVVRGQVVRTDPARFKAVGSQAATFYVCPDGVLDTEARRIPGADPATFTVQGPFGRDQYRWYRRDGQVIEDAGPGGHVDDSLYFMPFILLLGSGAVYLGESRLPVDAASCEVIRKRALRRDPRVGALLWLRDKAGDVIVSCWGRFGGDMTPEVQRRADPEAAWAQAEAHWHALLDAPDPIDRLRAEVKQAQAQGGDVEAFAAFFADWAAHHREAVWREDPYNSFFWEGLEQYAHSLLGQGQAEPLLACFEAVKAEAWRWPSILEPVALACLVMGRPDDALAAVRRGAWSSFHLASRLLARPEFADLVARDDAADLRSLAEYLRESPGSKPALPASLAVHWLDAIPEGIGSMPCNTSSRSSRCQAWRSWSRCAPPIPMRRLPAKRRMRDFSMRRCSIRSCVAFRPMTRAATTPSGAICPACTRACI